MKNSKTDKSDKNSPKTKFKPYKSDEKEKFAIALVFYLGNVTQTCKHLNISRQTYYDWKKNDEAFAYECDVEVGECIADFVESKLFELIEQGNTRAILFYCQTKLKDRGYGSNLEVTAKNGASFELEAEKDRYSKLSIQDLDLLKNLEVKMNG